MSWLILPFTLSLAYCTSPFPTFVVPLLQTEWTNICRPKICRSFCPCSRLMLTMDIYDGLSLRGKGSAMACQTLLYSIFLYFYRILLHYYCIFWDLHLISGHFYSICFVSVLYSMICIQYIRLFFLYNFRLYCIFSHLHCIFFDLYLISGHFYSILPHYYCIFLDLYLIFGHF